MSRSVLQFKMFHFKILFVFSIVFVKCRTDNSVNIVIENGDKVSHNNNAKGDVAWESCGTTGNITRVWVEDCHTNPCVFETQRYYTLTMNFIPADSTNSLRYKAWYYDYEENYQDFDDYPLVGIYMAGQEYVASSSNCYFPRSLSATRGFIEIQIWDTSFEHPVACAEFETLTLAI